MTWPARMTHTFEIIPRAPYPFDLTAARFGRFASEIVDLLDGKHYCRLLAAGQFVSRLRRLWLKSLHCRSQKDRYRCTSLARLTATYWPRLEIQLMASSVIKLWVVWLGYPMAVDPSLDTEPYGGFSRGDEPL